MGGESDPKGQGRRYAYRELYEYFASRIDSGQAEPGTKLPTYPEIKEHWGVSHATVTKAIRLLRENGYVRSTTQGVFVAFSQSERLLRQLCDTLNELKKTGQDPQFEVNRTGSCVVTTSGTVCWNAEKEMWETQVF